MIKRVLFIALFWGLAFSARSQTFLMREHAELFEFKSLKIELLTVTVLPEETINHYLRFNHSGSSVSERDEIRNLTLQEVDSLISAIDYFRNNVVLNLPFNYTEAEFSTDEDGVGVTVYWNAREKYWAAVYESKNRIGPDRAISFNLEDLAQFHIQLQTARQKLVAAMER